VVLAANTSLLIATHTGATVGLFAQEMKYPHDNGFRVLLLNQLGYNQNNEYSILHKKYCRISSILLLQTTSLIPKQCPVALPSVR